MTIDEVKKGIQSMVLKPEEAADIASGLISAIEQDYAAATGLSAKIAEQDDKIRSLYDTNARLLLRVTGDPGMDEPPEKTLEERVNGFWEKFTDKEDK